VSDLIACRVCGKKVSREAFSCPHCGDPYITKEKKLAAVLKVENEKKAAEKEKKAAKKKAMYDARRMELERRWAYFVNDRWRKEDESVYDNDDERCCPVCGKKNKKIITWPEYIHSCAIPRRVQYWKPQCNCTFEDFCRKEGFELLSPR
jgi:RNA polymerase subunit RPABC4/transcription elongation factor Spt4